MERDIALATVRFAPTASDGPINWYAVRYGLPGAPAALGHYFVGNTGDVAASGVSPVCARRLRTASTVPSRLSGDAAQSTTSAESAYLLLVTPKVLHRARAGSRRSTSVETKCRKRPRASWCCIADGAAPRATANRQC
jgi:hypothetical protein